MSDVQELRESFLNAFPAAALLLWQDRIVAVNGAVRRRLPQLEPGEPIPPELLALSGEGGGLVTLGGAAWRVQLTETKWGRLAVLIPAPQPALTGAAARLQSILRAMQESPEEARSNADYAAALGISEYHFVRLFRSLTGQTPHRYRIGILMQKARQLLLDTDLNVSEIAQSLNIGDALYFSRLFKKVWGVSPSRCRAASTQENVRL